jgi:glycosyltransferase involved in cell wall biosynthesis
VSGGEGRGRAAGEPWVDLVGIEARFAAFLGGDGRLRQDLDERVYDAFALDAFVAPAGRLLEDGAARLRPQELERWMAHLNDQDPRWRHRPSVWRFCRSRRRELLAEACLREDLALLRDALGYRKALTAFRRSQVEHLRSARRIAQVLALRALAGRRAGEGRDCLFVIKGLRLGGLERAQVQVANAVAALGRTVDLLNLGGIAPVLRAELDPRVQLVDRMTALRRRYAAGVNYSNWLFPGLLTRGIRAGRRIQWVHSDLLTAFERFPRDRWAAEYGRIDRFVCVSDWSRRGLERLYPFAAGRAETILSFYDTDSVLRRAEEAPEARLRRDLPAAITVARLAEPKGLERAIRAHRSVIERGVHFRWYVVGEGAQRPKLEALIRQHGLEGRFILLGEVANPFPLMKQADFFVLPSFHEGFSLATVEAKTLRLPILLTDFGSARESVEDGVEGLVARGNTRCLAEGLERLATDAGLRARLRENLRSFRWDNGRIQRQVEAALFS